MVCLNLSNCSRCKLVKERTQTNYLKIEPNKISFLVSGIQAGVARGLVWLLKSYDIITCWVLNLGTI